MDAFIFDSPYIHYLISGKHTNALIWHVPFLSDTAAHVPQTHMKWVQTYVITHQLLFICSLHHLLSLAESRNYHLYQKIETVPLSFTSLHVSSTHSTFLIENFPGLKLRRCFPNWFGIKSEVDLHFMPSRIHFCRLCFCEVVCSARY